MISVNKTIAYTKNWKHTLIIAFLLGVLTSTILIFLEPFDTTNDFPLKKLRLAGYAFCIIIPILAIHYLENYIYKKQKNRWFVLNEAIYISATLFLILLSCFFYHSYVLSDLSMFELSKIWDFIWAFGLPFTPIIVPLWLYLRSKYGAIKVPLESTDAITKEKKITITGASKTEKITILESQFIYAQSQQNYVYIHFKTGNDVEKIIFRSTLSNIMKQLPNAWQVHRSYLVNLDFLLTVKGNARQRFMTISQIEETIPISQKYYTALAERLSKSSQNLQN